MELVSRWGSPLTSEAPHSLAYPGPVKKEGPHHSSFWLPRLHRRADSVCLVVGGPSLRLWRGVERCSYFWVTGQSLMSLNLEMSTQPGVTSNLQDPSSVCDCWDARFCWFSKVNGSVWEPVAAGSEVWHLNWLGIVTACCCVSHISHSEFGIDGGDMNLAWGHWPGSKILRFTITSYSHVLRLLKMRL